MFLSYILSRHFSCHVLRLEIHIVSVGLFITCGESPTAFGACVVLHLFTSHVVSLRRALVTFIFVSLLEPRVFVLCV